MKVKSLIPIHPEDDEEYRRIQIYIWDRTPETDLVGMELFATVNLNENFSLSLSGDYQWISIFALNDGYDYDGCCFDIVGNTIRILGFD